MTVSMGNPKRNDIRWQEYQRLGYGIYKIGDAMHSHITSIDGTILRKSPNKYNCCFYCVQLGSDGYFDGVGLCDFFGSEDKMAIDNTDEKTCNLFEPHLNRFHDLLENTEKGFRFSTNFDL